MKKIGVEKIIFGGLLAVLIALRLTATSMTEAQAATYGPNGNLLMNVTLDGDDKISADELAKKLGDTDPDETRVFTTKSGIIWNFDGDKIKNANQGISSFKVDIKTTIDDATLKEVVGDSKAVVLDFENSGTLPGEATIRVPSSKLSSLGTTRDICVYFYNNGKLTEGQRGLVISGGYLEFTISHCSEYVIKIEEGSTKDDDDDDDHHHHEKHTVASWVKNPNEKQQLVMTGVSLPAGTSLGWAEQGDLGKLAFKAATPAGWAEAFSFNMLTSGKPEYTLKNGTMTLLIPSSYQKAGRTYAVLAIDQSGAVLCFPDTDTNNATVTANINVTGYAFDLIYTE